MREALFSGVRPHCPVSPLPFPPPQPQPPGTQRLARRKAQQPGPLLPALTSSPLWGCQAPGQGLGRGTADFCLVLMLAVSLSQACEPQQARYVGADAVDRHAFELGVRLPSSRQGGQGVCGHCPLPLHSRSTSRQWSFFPKDLVLEDGPGASTGYPAVLFRYGCPRKHP